MRLARRVFIIFLGCLALAVQFTNCGQVEPQQAAAPTEDCAATNSCTSNPANDLDISTTVTEIVVGSTQLTYDLGGFCSPSTFPYNAVVWRLYDGNGVAIDNHCNFSGNCGRCVTGQFVFNGANTIQFHYPPVTGWIVEIEIQGVDSTMTLSYPGQGLGKSIRRLQVRTL